MAGDSKFVFPGRAAGKPLSNNTFSKALERMGREDVTTHGFRSSFRDWAAECTPFSRQERERGSGSTSHVGIVEAHGGRVWADSSPQGATVVFTLPLEPRRD